MTSRETRNSLKGYYRVHSRLYDATRWIFLFGRSTLLDAVRRQKSAERILEVGCGTGTNLIRLARVFPAASFLGVDLSEHMLQRAHRKARSTASRCRFLHQAYDDSVGSEAPFDLVLFSYSLSMFNPGWEQALENARRDLAPGGLIAVVDFHETPFRVFNWWMGAHRVRLGGHLLEGLQSTFVPKSVRVRPAFLGLWTYFQFIGERNGS